ncbi:MAG: hypothetical protein CEO12_163 [Parcubacteria group bacterium Gr01-1014_46]|nr:MAG: hypothetical protein CEO12_163 [Parcubacteria group bacterium Gr01-1014_46]
MTQKEIINTTPKKSPVEILTRQQLHKTAVERVHLIAEEFTDAFNFLQKYPKSVTVFGGTRFVETDPQYASARSLSGRIAKELNYSVITGGGPGIMEAANRGAFEAGGTSLGLTIELSNHQIKNDYLTDNLDFYYFFSRKVCMSFSAEAYIFFPGGYGTLDEFFEIVTLVQTKKIEAVPIILVGSDFWKPLDELMRKELLGRGTIDPDDLDLYKIVDDENEIMEIVKNSPIRNGVQFTHNHIHSEQK